MNCAHTLLMKLSPNAGLGVQPFAAFKSAAAMCLATASRPMLLPGRLSTSTMVLPGYTVPPALVSNIVAATPVGTYPLGHSTNFCGCFQKPGVRPEHVNCRSGRLALMEANDDAGTHAPGAPAMTDRGAAAINTGATLKPPRSKRLRATSAANLASGEAFPGVEFSSFGLSIMVTSFYRERTWLQAHGIPRSVGPYGASCHWLPGLLPRSRRLPWIGTVMDHHPHSSAFCQLVRVRNAVPLIRGIAVKWRAPVTSQSCA